MSDLADFVLDVARALGGVVEPPAYGVHDVLLPDRVAAQLDVDAFQRWTFAEEAAAGGVTCLSHDHPLVERLMELVRAAPACARFYINSVRLDKTGLFARAREGLAFPNANLVEDLSASETRALFHIVRFNFKAALLSDEKHERLVSVLIDAHTGSPVDEYSSDETLRLEETPLFAALPDAPAPWLGADSALNPHALQALLGRATEAAGAALGEPLLAVKQRAARLLELDRARLVDYYGGLERDLERRLSRVDDDARRAALASKLAATRADQAAKLADTEAKHAVSIELELVNLAVITQPKLLLPARVENRQAGAACNLVWDPLRHRVEPLVCDVCHRPATRLSLCANGHLACEGCLAPQCVDCKRVYCRDCAHEVMRCVVCERPVCRKSLIQCRECDKGTCREHVGACHAPPAPEPATQPVAEAPPKKPARSAKDALPSAPRPRKTAAAKQPPRRVEPAPDYILEVEVRGDEALVVAFVLTRSRAEVAQRSWRWTDDGIVMACLCEKGWRCPSARDLLEPEPPTRIEAQIEAEIERLRGEYRIPPYRAAIYIEERGEFNRSTRLRLRGVWKTAGR